MPPCTVILTWTGPQVVRTAIPPVKLADFSVAVLDVFFYPLCQKPAGGGGVLPAFVELLVLVW